MALMNPITITYLTDNTAFYFWCTICLRLLPIYATPQRRPVSHDSHFAIGQQYGPGRH